MKIFTGNQERCRGVSHMRMRNLCASDFPLFLAYTLIELLITIAIIFILASLLFPSFRTMREKSHQIVCSNHLKQLGMFTLMYTSDYNGYITPYCNGTGTWYTILISDGYYNVRWANRPLPTLLTCPKSTYNSPSSPGAMLKWGYGMNMYSFAASLYFVNNLSKIPKPSLTMLYLDSMGGSTEPPYLVVPVGDAANSSAATPGYRHPGHAANIVCVDGHVEAKKTLPTYPDKNCPEWRYNY